MRMGFAFEMSDLGAEQEEVGEALAVQLGLQRPDWDVEWTPGFIRVGDDYRASFSIRGEVEAEANREALIQAVSDAFGPAADRVVEQRRREGLQTVWPPFRFSVYFPQGAAE